MNSNYSFSSEKSEKIEVIIPNLAAENSPKQDIKPWK